MKKIVQQLQRARAANGPLLFITILLCVLLVPAVSHAQPPAISVCTLSQNRATYDLKPISVSGVVTSIKNRKAPSGRRYTLVQLKDTQGQCWVRLFTRHHSLFLQKGQQIELFGRYFQNFRYFRWTYKYEIHPVEFKVNGCAWLLTQYGWAKKPG